MLKIEKEEKLRKVQKRTLEKIGMVNKNNFGTDMKIIEVLLDGRVIIQFQDDHKYEKNILLANFKSGNVENPYDRKVFNHGYIGFGKYKPKENRVLNVMYQTWRDMLVRCYYEHKKEQNKSYYGICTVCEEWLNYQNFAKWYENNIYPMGDERIHVDKDILHKGNKIYSPDNCLLVPQRINMLFVEKENKWGFPSGISLSKTGKYITSYNTKHLGSLDTLEEAIAAHDKEKRTHIREVIDEYKNIIPDKVINALLKW